MLSILIFFGIQAPFFSTMTCWISPMKVAINSFIVQDHSEDVMERSFQGSTDGQKFPKIGNSSGFFRHSNLLFSEPTDGISSTKKSTDSCIVADDYLIVVHCILFRALKPWLVASSKEVQLILKFPEIQSCFLQNNCLDFFYQRLSIFVF